MLRDTAKPFSSVTWIFPPPIEIPVTLIVLCSFLTVIFVVLGWGALLSFDGPDDLDATLVGNL